jgi:hypothetical protein
VTLPIVTTNHPVEALHLPPDDRRILAAISKEKKENFTTAYWDAFYHWYEHEGGIGHVVAYLKTLDPSDLAVLALSVTKPRGHIG